MKFFEHTLNCHLTFEGAATGGKRPSLVKIQLSKRGFALATPAPPVEYETSPLTQNDDPAAVSPFRYHVLLDVGGETPSKTVVLLLTKISDCQQLLPQLTVLSTLALAAATIGIAAAAANSDPSIASERGGFLYQISRPTALPSLWECDLLKSVASWAMSLLYLPVLGIIGCSLFLNNREGLLLRSALEFTASISQLLVIFLVIPGFAFFSATSAFDLFLLGALAIETTACNRMLALLQTHTLTIAS